MDALLATVPGFSPGLELDRTLRRVVATTTDPAGAGCGALAAVDQDGATTGFAGAHRERLSLTEKKTGECFTDDDDLALAGLAAADGIAFPGTEDTHGGTAWPDPDAGALTGAPVTSLVAVRASGQARFTDRLVIDGPGTSAGLPAGSRARRAAEPRTAVRRVRRHVPGRAGVPGPHTSRVDSAPPGGRRARCDPRRPLVRPHRTRRGGPSCGRR